MLTFDEKTHTYRWNDQVVPSVTQVIKSAGLMPDMKWIDPWYMERGRLVHLACEMFDEGTLDEDQLDPEIRPYVMAYKGFREANEFEVLEVEKRCYHPSGYAGQMDRVILWQDRRAIMDLKCGPKEAWHGLQLAGYAEMDPEATMRIGLHLTKKGRASIEIYKQRSDRVVFQSAVTLWQWKTAHGLPTT